MPLKDIIVHLDRGPGCTARVMAAINLARQHKAFLKGIYVITHPFYMPQSPLERDYNEIRTFFVNAASKSGVRAELAYIDWNVAGVSLSEVMAFHAYATDVLIIGQPVDGRSRRGGNHELLERLILGVGRPVVVFPAETDLCQFGTKVLVAWKGGREACRAVHDALPFLVAASQVDVVAIVSGARDMAREEDGLLALRDHLARHAIDARTEVVLSSRRSVAHILLSRLSAEQADLLVMGGFGYTPRGVAIFPQLSREVMAGITVPILFSH